MKYTLLFLALLLALTLSACGTSQPAPSAAADSIEKTEDFMDASMIDVPDTEPPAPTLELPILDEIAQNTTVGTAGSFMTAVHLAVKLLDWGANTGLDPEEIREAAVAWLAGKGNDEQVAFGEKLALVDEAYQKLLTDEVETLLSSAGLEDTERFWPDSPVEPIEAIMEAAGLR